MDHSPLDSKDLQKAVNCFRQYHTIALIVSKVITISTRHPVIIIQYKLIARCWWFSLALPMFVVAVISLEVSTLTIAVALVVFGFISYLVTISLALKKVLCHLTANDTLKIEHKLDNLARERQRLRHWQKKTRREIESIASTCTNLDKILCTWFVCHWHLHDDTRVYNFCRHRSSHHRNIHLQPVDSLRLHHIVSIKRVWQQENWAPTVSWMK